MTECKIPFGLQHNPVMQQLRNRAARRVFGNFVQSFGGQRKGISIKSYLVLGLEMLFQQAPELHYPRIVGQRHHRFRSIAFLLSFR